MPETSLFPRSLSAGRERVMVTKTAGDERQMVRSIREQRRPATARAEVVRANMGSVRAGKGRVGSGEQRALAECASVVSAGREKVAGAQETALGRGVVFGCHVRTRQWLKR